MTCRRIGIGILALAMTVGFAANLYAIVGGENISTDQLIEFRREHEATVAPEDFDTKKEEEKRAYLIRTLEEKRQSAQTGSEEDKALGEEILKLKSQALLKKKSWKERIEFTPSERIVVDSNIRNQKEAKGDIIFHTGSGVQMDLGTDRTRFEVDYTGAHANYFHNHKLSRFEHNLGTSARYPVSSKTDVSGSYRLTSTGEQTSEIRNILKRLRQDIALTFNQRLSRKTNIRISQTYSDTFFTSRANRDNSSNQYVLSPELDYFLSSKTSFFGRYALGFSGGGVDDTNKTTAHELRGGLRGKIAPKTTALLDLGISRQNQRQLEGHLTAFVGEVVIITNITRKSKAELTFNRSFSQAVETEGSNFFVTENYKLSGTTQFRRFLAGTVFAGMRRNVFEQNGKVSGSTQHDLTLELGTTLRYDFRKWLTLEFRYLFSGVNASDSLREYAKHLFSFALIGRY